MRKVKFFPGEVYHIFNRGNNKRDIFIEERDMWRFLQGLALFNYQEPSFQIFWSLENTSEGVNMRTIKKFIEEKRQKNLPLVRIMADCLMPNHFHLILEEVQENGISNFMHRLGTGYVGFFNKKYDKSGGLFQGPFEAVHVDNDLYLQYLLIYINVINPGQLIEPKFREEGINDLDSIMDFAFKYKWSTHPEYLQIRDSFVVDKGVLGEIFSCPKEYEDFSKMVLEGKKYEQIKDLTLE